MKLAHNLERKLVWRSPVVIIWETTNRKGKQNQQKISIKLWNHEYEYNMESYEARTRDTDMTRHGNHEKTNT